VFLHGHGDSWEGGKPPLSRPVRAARLSRINRQPARR